MIRARLSNGCFLMGVDAENVKRLTNGMPLVIDLIPLGGVDKVMILYGETAHDIMAQLEAANGGPLPPPQSAYDVDGGPVQ
jgi:hypothetical protein